MQLLEATQQTCHDNLRGAFQNSVLSASVLSSSEHTVKRSTDCEIISMFSSITSLTEVYYVKHQGGPRQKRTKHPFYLEATGCSVKRTLSPGTSVQVSAWLLTHCMTERESYFLGIFHRHHPGDKEIGPDDPENFF